MPLPALLLLFAAFAGLGLLLYAPALDGPFVSDDRHYIATNPYVQEPSLENLVGILDPTSASTLFLVNYAPVQLLIHVLEWQLFGDDVRGYHVVNVLLHALAAALLAALLRRSGLSAALAAAGGAVFLVHPAQVEAVAWISQLKTAASLVLALGALLAWPGRPAAASALFALALLAKGTAAFALPVAALLDWTQGRALRGRWIALWALLLLAYLVPEFATHQRSGAAEPPHPDAATALRSSFAIALRYLAMAATSFGVSSFQEPPPARSWLDPWWLGALAALGALGARLLHCLRGRRPEAAWWAWALVSFVPVSQLFPFRYPMADRYLYFMLPGLLGGVLLAGRDALGRVSPALRSRLQPLLWLALGALVLGFALQSHERARIWRSPIRILVDAALHYPEGISAQLLRAHERTQQGDAAGAVAALRAAAARGFNHYQNLVADPALAPLRGDPGFRALVAELAAVWIARLSALEDPTQIELRHLAEAHLARGEQAEAVALLERALALGGPLDERLRKDLEELRH